MVDQRGGVVALVVVVGGGDALGLRDDFDEGPQGLELTKRGSRVFALGGATQDDSEQQRALVDCVLFLCLFSPVDLCCGVLTDHHR